MTQPDAIRSLIVVGGCPWPSIDGYRQRNANFIEALSKMGDVDVFCIEADMSEAATKEALSMAPPGVRVVFAPWVGRTLVQRMRVWATTGLPRMATVTDPAPILDRLRTELRGPYDVTLIGNPSPWFDFKSLTTSPMIVDINDLSSMLLRAYAEQSHPRSVRERLRRRLDVIDARRMERLEHLCAAAADAVAVCSELDVRRSNLTNAVSIPNGYTRRRPIPPRAEPGSHPEIVFVGQLGYAPNADAARWFAEDIFPLVREQIPGAVFRIVGRNGDDLADLNLLAGVTLVGGVDDLDAELDRSDLAVVPLRFGAGTRLKVLEAMANRLPIVSTTLGSEGIDVRHREHAMLANSESEIAEACVEVLRSPSLSQSLARNGEALWEERYRWESIHERIAEMVRSVLPDTVST